MTERVGRGRSPAHVDTAVKSMPPRNGTEREQTDFQNRSRSATGWPPTTGSERMRPADRCFQPATSSNSARVAAAGSVPDA